MKNAIVLSLAALALVACGSKEEAAVPAAEAPVVAEAPAAEAAPAEANGVGVQPAAEAAPAPVAQ